MNLAVWRTGSYRGLDFPISERVGTVTAGNGGREGRE